jgi:hypothetical protein
VNEICVLYFCTQFIGNIFLHRRIYQPKREFIFDTQAKTLVGLCIKCLLRFSAFN